MKKIILMAILSLTVFVIKAQQDAEKEAIINVIKTLFDAYRAQDTSVMSKLFHADATMGSAGADKDGKPMLRKGDVQGFLNFAGTKNGNYYDERIYSYDVTIDGPLATAWTEYSFFLNKNFSHCGYNVFTLFKSADGWKIINITDTRRKTGCKTE
ncbi:MAG: nuclear transport factor 2 family protein [Saprospiraceae bacterium]|nr:nuclear transport factor 2 family protein [Saprospiraceae bacterium]